jgi:hypothetical protein
MLTCLGGLTLAVVGVFVLQARGGGDHDEILSVKK